jgi:hypothetical protein
MSRSGSHNKSRHHLPLWCRTSVVPRNRSRGQWFTKRTEQVTKRQARAAPVEVQFPVMTIDRTEFAVIVVMATAMAFILWLIWFA